MKTPEELLRFVELFNQEEFFEAHEVLEALWRRETGSQRNFYQGLIQVAAVFVHLQKGTPQGAKQLLESSSGYLLPYGPERGGISLNDLLEATRLSVYEDAAYPHIVFTDN